jgi:circadian clock protein KaiB
MKTDITPPEHPERYKLMLFITGSTPRSTRAIDNMRRICEENLKGQYDLEVIDVYQNPEATKQLQIVATPTLVKVLPEPLRRILGDLSDKERVLAGLNLIPAAGGAPAESPAP